MPICIGFQNWKQWIQIALAVFAAMPSLAADVKLTNGQIYRNVTVLTKDGKDLQIQLGYQKMSIPMQVVESIDGVPVRAAAATTARQNAPVKQAVVPSPTPTVPAPVAVPSATVAPAAAEASPAPFPMEASSSLATAVEEKAKPQLPPLPPYEHRWNMDLLLGAFAAFSAIWLASVACVQRDLFNRRLDPRFWSNVAVALPGLGYGLYSVVRGIGDIAERRRAAKAPRNINEKVAERENATHASHRKGFEFLDDDRKAILVKNNGLLSGIESAREVLEEALLERASDVHIEPAECEYRVRFRIDGVMQLRMSYDRNDGQKIISALKTLGQIDVAEKRKAQDGRFRVRTGDNVVDFRVATANSIFGEKLVIRILDRKMGLLGLNDLGMPQAMMEEFTRVIHSRSGMILATGPTGSGKTSTLYSALSQIDAKRMNVVTIEDPVEYELTGATQMPVNIKAGVTYESGLRSLLRQDPDVIFVGEMRDIEAAQVALRAALTGHLLFTSLHTKDAVGTIIRLEEMGIERTQLSSALLVVVAQRLVRVLCPACREACVCSGDELREIGIELPAGAAIFQAKGCPVCRETGYVGRTGIFEMIVFDEELRHAVNSGAGERELAEIARRKGHRSYREEGAEKLLLGVTSVEEILQAN